MLLNTILTIFSLKLVFLIAVGTFSGIYVGAIPGLSVTMAVSILISFTFSWDLLDALALMVGIYCGGVYGGSRSAILLNIPGAPSAIATSFDGYPLAKKGKAGIAIGFTTTQSFIGGIFGCIILTIAAPMIAEFALKFSASDYFLLAMMGLMMVGALCGGSFNEGIFTGAFGVLLSLVGMDPFTGQGRFTFNSLSLMIGINYVAAMIGLFGISEALFQARNIYVKPVRQEVKKIIPSLELVFKYMSLTLKSSIIGTFIGALPGTGAEIAALIAYDRAKRSTKNPSTPFGEGAYEGLVAPESANNAAIGGAFIPMLTLGIPGDSATAIFIGALYIHGLKPGPMLMIETPYIFWFIVISLFISNIFLLIFGLTGIRMFCKITEIPKKVLIPLIIVISIVGAYAINNNFEDVWWAIGFGIIGYILKMYNMQVGPIILGIILGPLIEVSYRRAMLQAHNNLITFIFNLFKSPISIVILIFMVFMLIQGFKFKKYLDKKM